MPDSRLLLLDIEASNLNADFGIILAFGYKWLGEGKAKVLNILDYRDDGGDLLKAERRMLKDISRLMLAADEWSGHFAIYYDIPFIQSRLLYHRLPVLPPTPIRDTWRAAKNKLKLRNNRLNTVQGFLKLSKEKTAIEPEQWLRALGGHRPSMQYIVDHCRIDVEVLEEAFVALRPLMTDGVNRHTVVNGKCGICGSKDLQRRGNRQTKMMVIERHQCQACGSWLSGKGTRK